MREAGMRVVACAVLALGVLPAAAMAAVEIVDGPPARTNQTSATFTFTGGRSYECDVDLAVAYSPCDPTFLVKNLAEGTHVLQVRELGSGDTPVTYPWAVDLTPPETVLGARPANPSNATAAHFAFSSPDAGATFDCSLDGVAPTACTAPLDLAGLGEGSHQLVVRATDQAGNTDPAPVIFNWVVDTTPPDTAIASAPSGLVKAGPASFQFATENGTGFECARDGGAFAACPASLTLGPLPDGDHHLDVRAVDAAGNADPTPATATWTVDGTAPPAPLVTIAALQPHHLKKLPGGLRATGSTPTPLGTVVPALAPVVPAAPPAYVVSHDLRVAWSAPGEAATTTFSVKHTRSGGPLVWPASIGTLVASGAPAGGAAIHVEEGLSCFTVRATDAAGNTSPPRTACTTVPTGWPAALDADGQAADGVYSMILGDELLDQHVAPDAQAWDGTRRGLAGDVDLWVGPRFCSTTFQTTLCQPDDDSSNVPHASVALVVGTCRTCGALEVRLEGLPTGKSPAFDHGTVSYSRVVNLQAAKPAHRRLVVLPASGRTANDVLLHLHRIRGTPRIEGFATADPPPAGVENPAPMALPHR